MRRSAMAVLLLVLTMLSAALMAGCGGSSDTGTTDTGAQVNEGDAAESRTFTLAELAEFDGKDGGPAYVAVDGVVYDVTGSSQWPDGVHTPCNLDATAGKDLSQALRQAPPRMRGYIMAMPVIGTLK